MTQKETDIAMLKMTILWGMNSKAKRMKVGALVVKNQQIISDGFNGTPSGFDNTCEENVTIELLGHGGAIIHQPTPELKTKEIVLHAESNAISKLAKHGSIGADGSTMYVTVAPCINCAKLVIQAGIKRVVYVIEYRDSRGLELLREAGLDTVQYKELEDFYHKQIFYSVQEKQSAK